MGGPSSEHDVSLATGRNVVENLDRSKYEPIGIKITKDKEWFIGGRKILEMKALAGCDVIFNALHGTFGEDGRIQAFLEYYEKPYTGSGIVASALAMDKLRSREVFKMAGLKVPKTLKVRRGDNYDSLVKVFVNKVTNFPVVVKPCSNGSSVGVSIVQDNEQLGKAITATFKLDKKVLIEEFIKGTEVTCGVLQNFNGKRISALPITEIVPRKGNTFFNYKAKYKSGHSDEITPARINSDITAKVQEIAEKAHESLGCRAYSRTDMIISGKDIYVLETNTLPGLTSASLFPKAASVAGLSFPQLLEAIISNSLA